MKKLIYAAMCSLSLCLYGCDYDDTDVWNAINDQEGRIAALEEWQKTANENIAALQALVNRNDYITGVDVLKEGDVEVGYVIHFYRQGDITIYHGEQGEKGEAGTTPVIGVILQEDGYWYWTLNGELLTDADGNPICASGKDGEDGQDGEDGKPGSDGKPGTNGASAPIPQLKTGSELGDGYIADAVYLSVNGGVTWVKVSGDNGTSGTGTPGFIIAMTDNGDCYTFECIDGTMIDVPKYRGLRLLYLEQDENQNWKERDITNGELEVPANKDFTIQCYYLQGYKMSYYILEGKKDWSIQRNDYAADSPVITDLIFTGVTSAEPTLILFSLVAEDNSVTHYQVMVEVAEEDQPSGGVITGTDGNAELVSALAGLGIGTKDEDGNLRLTQAEIDATTTLDLSGKGLNTLEGLEVFSNLTQLSCSNNQIAELDLAKLPRLTYLDCSGNLLKGFDLSQTPDLTYLNCSDNALTSLDVSQLSELTELYCDNSFGNDEMTRSSFENGVLDLTTSNKLQRLGCSGNRLTGLILPVTETLKEVYCPGNRLASIDVSMLKKLEVLEVSDNLLTQIDVSSNSDLTILSCNGNKLTEINVTVNRLLANLSCAYNQLTSINVSSNTLLSLLRCDGNALTELDVTLCTNLTDLACCENQMNSLNLLHNDNLTYLHCGNQVNAEGNMRQLTLYLADSLKELWRSDWMYESDNVNVIVDGITTTLPGNSGSDFEDGGKY